MELIDKLNASAQQAIARATESVQEAQLNRELVDADAAPIGGHGRHAQQVTLDGKPGDALIDRGCSAADLQTQPPHNAHRWVIPTNREGQS